MPRCLNLLISFDAVSSGVMQGHCRDNGLLTELQAGDDGPHAKTHCAGAGDEGRHRDVLRAECRADSVRPLGHKHQVSERHTRCMTNTY